MPSGGLRVGAGRKKGIPTKPIRVPLDIYPFVEALSLAVRKNPENYLHLSDFDRARYMVDCLSNGTASDVISASSRYKKKKKR